MYKCLKIQFDNFTWRLLRLYLEIGWDNAKIGGTLSTSVDDGGCCIVTCFEGLPRFLATRTAVVHY